MQTTLYAIKISLVSMFFIVFTLFGLSVLGEKLSWLEVGITIAAFVVADILLLITTGRPQKNISHADTTKSTH